MANLTSSSSSSSPPFPSISGIPPVSASSPSAVFDDCSEDSCSICLEPFSTDDPATITSCKHEYHMHCILDWSQRSKECPICWQLLVLKDPASQELLAAVKNEKRLRSRNIYSSAFTNSSSSLEQPNAAHDNSGSDYSDFDEQIMQHIVAAASRVNYVCRRARQRSSGAGPSKFLVFNSSVQQVSGVQPAVTASPSGGSSPTSGGPSAADIQPAPPSAFSPVAVVGRNTIPESDAPFKPRVLYSRPPPDTSEMFSFPESIKSKFSAASARYKESISKSTRGLKEKFLAHNTSVKDLSKGVQREMNAGIAGVARMIERLDLTSKRATPPLIPTCTVGTSGFPLEGKTVQEHGIIGQSPNKESEVVVRDTSSDVPFLVSSMASGRVEVPTQSAESGYNAVKS